MAIGDVFLLGCIDDAAYIAAATKTAKTILVEAAVQTAVQLALMEMRRNTQIGIADMQKELADRRVKLAEVLLKHAQLAWAKESQLVGDVMAEPINTPIYTDVTIIQGEATRVQELALRKVLAESDCSGVAIGACAISRMRRGLATARTDFVGHVMRTAEARSIQLNDRRYSRQLSVLGMGHNILQNAMSLGALGSATNTAVRTSLMRTINSGMELWGYSSTRWQRGQNYNTAPNGAPRVVQNGVPLYSDGRYASRTPIQVNVNNMIDPRADENGVRLPDAEPFDDVAAF